MVVGADSTGVADGEATGELSGFGEGDGLAFAVRSFRFGMMLGRTGCAVARFKVAIFDLTQHTGFSCYQLFPCAFSSCIQPRKSLRNISRVSSNVMRAFGIPSVLIGRIYPKAKILAS